MPPPWERDAFKHELESYAPPHLFLLNRAFCTGLLFFSGSRSEKIPLAFVYISSYLNKNKEKICRIERLSYLECNKEVQLQILEEILKIATHIYGKINIFETEVFLDINSPIFFPSSLFILGSCNKKEDVKLYQDFDFELVQKKYCYEIDLHSNTVHKIPNRRTRPIKPDEWSNYWAIWGMTKYCLDTSYLFKMKMKTGFGNLIQFFSDPSYTMMYEEFGSFFDRIAGIPSVEGFVQWAPNIYRSFLSGNKFNLRQLDSSCLNEARIFKLGLKSRDGSEPSDSYGNMLELTLPILKSKGVRKCQLGNFEESHPAMVHLKKKLAGKCVQAVGILQKRLE
jgi:hypothetical protein